MSVVVIGFYSFALLFHCCCFFPMYKSTRLTVALLLTNISIKNIDSSISKKKKIVQNTKFNRKNQPALIETGFLYIRWCWYIYIYIYICFFFLQVIKPDICLTLDAVSPYSCLTVTAESSQCPLPFLLVSLISSTHFRHDCMWSGRWGSISHQEFTGCYLSCGELVLTHHTHNGGPETGCSTLRLSLPFLHFYCPPCPWILVLVQYWLIVKRSRM